MRKQKLKNYLKLGIFLLGISLTIFACQEESINDLQEISQEKKLKRISLNELNTRIGNSESYTKLSAMFDINKPKTDGLQQRLENSDNPYLLTDEIAVVDTENAAFYTFKIESNDTGNEFYNLVVAMDEFNNIRSTRIFEYIPSDNWLQDTSQPFVGLVEVYENDIFSIDNINGTFSSRGTNECATGMDWEWVEIDCPNNCDCTACFDLLISVVYSDCPETIDAGGSGGGGGGFPVDGGNTGGGGGGTPGGSSDNNNDNGNPPADGENCILDNNGNCLTDETTPLPPKDSIQIDQHVISLNEQTNNTKVKNKIAALQGVVNSTLNEDGMQFDLIANSDPIDFNEVAPITDQTGTDHIKFPDVRTSTLVNLHLHPKYGLIEGIGTPQELSPIFSDGDLYFMLEFFEDTNNNEDISSLIVSAEGVFALRVTDADRATFMKNKLDIKRFWKRFLDDFKEEVLNSEDGQPPYTNEQIIGNFINFLNTYQINNSDNGQGFGLSLFQATIDTNGNITGWSQP